MKPAADKMEDKINNTNFKEPMIEIINNVTANAENNPEKNIKKIT